MSQNLKFHKDIKYSKDLTSLQIWQVFNKLLYEASAPLTVYGQFSIETAISCLILSTNNRRAIAADKANVFLSKVFVEVIKAVEHKDEEHKLSLLNMLFENGVERNIFTDHISISLKYIDLPKHIDRSKLSKHVHNYVEDYNKFKRDVLFRYYYMTQRSSHKNQYVKAINGLNSSPEENFHVYMISAMRAVDRFIPYKATLTAYIKQWFKNAEGSSDFMVYDGEAFSVNRSARKSIHDGKLELNNSAIPIEDRENFLVDEEAVYDTGSNIDDFLRICALQPNATLVFLAQAFPYKLNEEQKSRIAKFKG
jgi:hypothetical protein